MSLHQLIYISSASVPMDVDACRDIVRAARRNNAALGVTGLLLFNSRRFLQALEGERANVETLFERIRSDERHRAIVTLSATSVEEREFGNWSMAFDDPADQQSVTLNDKVAMLLTRAGPSTRALFETTAGLHRAS